MNSPSGWNWSAVFSGLTFLATVFTAAIVFGEMRGDIANTKEDVKQLQIDGRVTAVDNSTMKASLARIEAKLEWVVPSSIDRGHK